MTRQLREAQANLEKRSLQMEAVLTQIDAGVVLVDHQGVVLSLNPAASRLLGLDAGFVPPDGTTQTNTQMNALFNSKDQRPLLQILERALAGERSDPLSHSWTLRVGDEVKNLSAAATPLRESGKIWGAVAVIDDLTAVVKGQREMAWREVARRIAHEIKNPLTPIKLSAQRLQRRLQSLPGKDGQLLQECTTTIIEQTDELKELVNEFSNFARLPEVNPSLNSLHEVIEETTQLYQTANPDVHFDLNLDPMLGSFSFDRDQIKRCLMNLIDNAISAIRSARKNQVPQIWIETAFNAPLGRVSLIIRDNGPGMTEDIQERAFEPYFSTKSEGTGLGLAIVKRVINDHGGYIRLASRLEQGTTFTIELPSEAPAKTK